MLTGPADLLPKVGPIGAEASPPEAVDRYVSQRRKRFQMRCSRIAGDALSRYQ